MNDVEIISNLTVDKIRVDLNVHFEIQKDYPKTLEIESSFCDDRIVVEYEYNDPMLLMRVDKRIVPSNIPDYEIIVDIGVGEYDIVSDDWLSHKFYANLVYDKYLKLREISMSY